MIWLGLLANGVLCYEWCKLLGMVDKSDIPVKETAFLKML